MSGHHDSKGSRFWSSMMRRIGSESCFAQPSRDVSATVTLEPLCLHNIDGRAWRNCFRAIPLSVLASQLEIGWNAAVIGKMHVLCTSLWSAVRVHKPMTRRLEPPCSSIRSAPPSTQMPSTRSCLLYAPSHAWVLLWSKTCTFAPG